jgi:hypothetical protein
MTVLKVDRRTQKAFANMAAQRSARLEAQAASPVPLRSFTVTEAFRGLWQVGVLWWDNGASDYVTCVHDKLRRFYTVTPYRDHFDVEVGCYYYWCPWGVKNIMSGKQAEQFEMIDKYRTVLVTLDDANDELTRFKRTGYRGIYSVSRLDLNETGWGFQFDELLGIYKK